MLFLGLLKLCRRILFFLPFTTAQIPIASVGSQKAFSTYDNPPEWHLDYPDCGGQRQSPILINTNKTIPIEIPPITFGAYDVSLSEFVVLENTGSTIKFNVPPTIEGDIPFISDGPLNDTYQAVGVHFHWGSPGSKGSEHRINQKRYDLEMHIVHKNTKYASLEEAGEFENGISVIAVLFKVDKLAIGHFYPGLNTIFNSIPFVLLYGSTVSTKQLIPLGSLLGNIDRNHFYTYQGSLTTPPCSEAVTWIVYPEVIPISVFHLNNFWLVHDELTRRLWNNFRPLQPIGERKVYYRR